MRGDYTLWPTIVVISFGMKTLILYCSSTGSTQKYAEEIASATHADILPAKKFKKKMIKDYDTIVFGGWVMGSKIQGIDQFLQLWDYMSEKNVIVFSVGMSFPTKQARDDLISANLLDMYHLRYYMLRGNFEFNKLKFPYSFLFKNSLRMIANNPEATPDQKALLAIKDTPLIYHDEEGLNKIISIVNRLSAIPQGDA